MARPGEPPRRGAPSIGERTALVAVPVILFALDAVSKVIRGEATEFLLVPPLAVVVYLLFSEPRRTDARLRAVVLLPAIGAIAGEAGYAVLGPTPWGIAAVVLAVLLAGRALRARMPPALAIGILAMLLRVRGPWYPIDVAVSSLVVWGAFRAWQGRGALRTLGEPHAGRRRATPPPRP